MRKSWNPFGEGEDGMLKSAWETRETTAQGAGSATRRSKGAESVLLKGVHSDDGALETKNEQKRRESQ